MSVVTERWDICYYADFAHLISGIILCGVSLLTLTAISVDRLLALLLGLRYTYIVTTRKVYISVIVMWILSAFIGAANYSFHFLILGWSTFIIISLCVVISNFISKIFFTLRKRQFCVHNGAFQGERSQKIPLNIARYRKAVYSAVWVQVTLVVCYLPFGMLMALIRPESPDKSEITSSVYLAGDITLSFVLANSSLNPLLYCWRIREVRKAVKETIRHLLCSSN